jgi:hypothetical protein
MIASAVHAANVPRVRARLERAAEPTEGVYPSKRAPVKRSNDSPAPAATLTRPAKPASGVAEFSRARYLFGP